VNREPFGFLTYRGMDQMRGVGGRFRRRYERFGHRVSGSGGVAGDDKQTNQYSFLDHWNVQAYSTNYLRTVMSVQCFLDGLIGKYPNDDTNNNNTTTTRNNQNQIYAGGGLKRYHKDMGRYEQLAHSDMSTWTTKGDMVNVEDGSIKVQVRDKEIDTLNAFDRHPQMMNGLVKDVIATEQFQRIDGAAKPLADTLSTYLPGLTNAPQAFGGTPSGINWVHANDHFVCRQSHSVPLLAFSDYENIQQQQLQEKRGKKEAEEEKEKEKAAAAELASLADPVCAHLAWRFREWYRCPRLLSAVACPPFREMMEQMVEASATANNAEKNALGQENCSKQPFVLYSCHDVTLLALLYAIGADFLVSGEDCGGVGMSEEAHTNSGMDNAGYVTSRNTGKRRQTSWRWWPAYSSTIAFELVRLDDDQHVIRVILNGDTVRLIPRMSAEDEGLLKEQSLSSRQVFGEMNEDGKSHSMMRLSDFEQVIRVLEEAGGGSQEGGGRFSSMDEEGSNNGVELREMDKIGVDGG